MVHHCLLPPPRGISRRGEGGRIRGRSARGHRGTGLGRTRPRCVARRLEAAREAPRRHRARGGRTQLGRRERAPARGRSPALTTPHGNSCVNVGSGARATKPVVWRLLHLFLLRRLPAMMGTKIRDFAPLPDFSLEELVPKDNFYRRLEEALDLSFVRELVRDCYACSGRPSFEQAVPFLEQLERI